MAIPLRELSTTPLSVLRQKYGQKELDETEKLIASVRSDEEYMNLVDNDPGKMDFFSDEYANAVGSNLWGKAGKTAQDLMNIPAGIKQVLTTDPIETAKSMATGLNERYGITDVLSSGDFTKAKRTLATDPFGVALDLPMSGGGILGKLGRQGAKAGKGVANIIPHAASGLSGVDIEALRQGAKILSENDPTKIATFKSMVNRTGSETAAKMPAEAAERLRTQAKATRQADYTKGKWEQIPVSKQEIKAAILDKSDQIIADAEKTSGPAFRSERARKTILKETRARLEELANEPNPTIETVRKYRQGLDGIYSNVTEKYKYKITGGVVSDIRKSMDELVANKSKDLKASDRKYAEVMSTNPNNPGIASRFETLTDASSADAVVDKLIKMVEEGNPEALKLLQEVEQRTGVPLTAAASGSAMSTTSPAGLAGQSANMRAIRNLLAGAGAGGAAGFGAGGASGAGIGALIGALATTKLSSPQALGKTLIKGYDVYNKPRMGVGSIKDAHKAAGAAVNSTLLKTLLRSLMYTGTQTSRNRQGR